MIQNQLAQKKENKNRRFASFMTIQKNVGILLILLKIWTLIFNTDDVDSGCRKCANDMIFLAVDF